MLFGVLFDLKQLILSKFERVLCSWGCSFSNKRGEERCATLFIVKKKHHISL